jgi:inosine/xanthosine triphosphate pyrophosphatase family protein
MQVNSAVLLTTWINYCKSYLINRNAQFKTVVTLNLNGKQYLFTGIARGEITLSKVGKEGLATILSFNLKDINKLSLNCRLN